LNIKKVHGGLTVKPIWEWSPAEHIEADKMLAFKMAEMMAVESDERLEKI